MPYRLSADPQTRHRAQLVQTIHARILAAYENMRMTAIRSAQINKLIDVVENPGLADHGGWHQRGEHGTNGQSIGAGAPVDVICRLSPSASGHVLDNDVGIAWNMFPEK